MVTWYAENASARVLVSDSRMPTGDTEVRSSQHHRHRCLTQVILINRPIALRLGLWQDEDNRSLRRCQMASAHPDFRQLLKLARIRHENEVPFLPI